MIKKRMQHALLSMQTSQPKSCMSVSISLGNVAFNLTYKPNFESDTPENKYWLARLRLVHTQY